MCLCRALPLCCNRVDARPQSGWLGAIILLNTNADRCGLGEYVGALLGVWGISVVLVLTHNLQLATVWLVVVCVGCCVRTV